FVDCGAHPKRHLGAATDFEKIDILNCAAHRGLVVDLVRADNHLRLVGECDDGDAVVGSDIIGEKLDGFDYELKTSLVVHRTRAIEHDTEVEWHPSARGARSAAGYSLKEDIQDEIFRRRKHIFTARQRFKCERIGHREVLPESIVKASVAT